MLREVTLVTYGYISKKTDTMTNMNNYIDNQSQPMFDSGYTQSNSCIRVYPHDVPTLRWYTCICAQVHTSMYVCCKKYAKVVKTLVPLWG